METPLRIVFILWSFSEIVRTLFAALAIILLASPVLGHDLSVYTVVVNSEGAQPTDIPNGSLKEGDTAWFWMKDSTENTTLIIELEKGGAVMRSPVLNYECELHENGTQVNDDCKNRFDHTFNQYNSAGIWNLTFLKYVNDTLTETTNGSVFIEEDIHDEQPVEEQDDNKTESKSSSKLVIAGSVAGISLIAIAILGIKIKNENSQEEEKVDKVIPNP
ncbi:hypothetical protein N9V58_01510 [Candidatus Poseidoniales archaeon]|nr:hypothetical protein [Candidatus Poseidoniales archaeon]MDB2348455.1 hypothetical protein [Candidatus Poseidoniales archaeon]